MLKNQRIQSLGYKVHMMCNETHEEHIQYAATVKLNTVTLNQRSSWSQVTTVNGQYYMARDSLWLFEISSE